MCRFFVTKRLIHGFFEKRGETEIEKEKPFRVLKAPASLVFYNVHEHYVYTCVISFEKETEMNELRIVT